MFGHSLTCDLGWSKRSDDHGRLHVHQIRNSPGEIHVH